MGFRLFPRQEQRYIVTLRFEPLFRINGNPGSFECRGINRAYSSVGL